MDHHSINFEGHFGSLPRLSVIESAIEVTFVTLETAKELTVGNNVGNYIDEAKKAKKYAKEKATGLVKWATGINNLEDAVKCFDPRRIELKRTSQKVFVVEREASFLEMGREPAVNAIIAPIKWGSWIVLGTGAWCKVSTALGSECTGTLAKAGQDLFNTASSTLTHGIKTGVQAGVEFGTAVGAAASPYLYTLGSKIVNNPIGTIGLFTTGNLLMGAYQDFSDMSKTDDKLAKAIHGSIGFLKVVGSGIVITATIL